MKKYLIVLLICLLIIPSIAHASKIKDDMQEIIKVTPSFEKINAIIIFDNQPTSDDISFLKSYGVNVKNKHNIVNAVSVKVNPKTINNIVNRKSIKLIEPDYKVNLVLDNSAYDIQADDAWDLEITGKNVDVSIIDTGIHDEHPSLNVKLEKDYTGEGTDDLNGHGTHVAGIIGSTDSNYKGIAYEANLLNAKVLNKDGYGYGSDVISAIEWSVDNGAEIISLSLGAKIDNCDGTDAISQAVDKAVNNGVVVVVAAGNYGPDVGTIASPGCAKNAITVGAVDDNKNVPSWSSRGPTYDNRIKPDLVAPGVSIISTWNDNLFNSLSGTSMSTPHVSGAVALIIEAEPSISSVDIKDILKLSAVDLGLDSNTQGQGFLDVFSAINYVLNKSNIFIFDFSSNKEKINLSEEFLISLTVKNSGKGDATGTVAVIDIPDGLTSLDDSVKYVTEENQEDGFISSESEAYAEWIILSNEEGDYKIRVNVTSLDGGSDVSSLNIIVESDDESNKQKPNKTKISPPGLSKNKNRPGSAQYAIKRAFENLDILLTIDEAKKAEKHMQYALQRLNEIETLNEDGESEHFEDIMNDYEESLKNAESSINIAKDNGLNTKKAEHYIKISQIHNNEIISKINGIENSDLDTIVYEEIEEEQPIGEIVNRASEIINTVIEEQKITTPDTTSNVDSDITSPSNNENVNKPVNTPNPTPSSVGSSSGNDGSSSPGASGSTPAASSASGRGRGITGHLIMIIRNIING